MFLNAGPCTGAAHSQEKPRRRKVLIRDDVPASSTDPPVEALIQAPDEAQQDVENEPGAGNTQNSKAGPGKQLRAAAKSAKEAGVSQYEQARKQRMQANFEKLRSLGLSGGITDAIGVPTTVKKRPSKRRSDHARLEEPPVRRMTRSSAFCLTVCH